MRLSSVGATCDSNSRDTSLLITYLIQLYTSVHIFVICLSPIALARRDSRIELHPSQTRSTRMSQSSGLQEYMSCRRSNSNRVRMLVHSNRSQGRIPQSRVRMPEMRH